MFFKVDVKGSFNNTELFAKSILKMNVMGILTRYAEQGVVVLSSATPMDTGLAAYSWDYEVTKVGGGYTISWTNSDVENGFPVVISLQYGYGTGTGGYVQGRDFINPAVRPIMDKIANEVWKVVTSA